MTESTCNHRYGLVAAMTVAGLVVGSLFGFLVGNRAEVDARMSALPMEERRELLKYAVWADLPQATRLLLDGVDVNSGADDGTITLLHHAVDIDAPRSADVLLAAGADPYARAGGGQAPVDRIKSEEMWRVFVKHARTAPETAGIPMPVLGRFLPQAMEGPVLVSFNGGQPPVPILRLLEDRNPEAEIALDESAFPDGGQTLVLILERLAPDRIRFEKASRKKNQGMSGGGVGGTYVKRHGYWVMEDRVQWDE